MKTPIFVRSFSEMERERLQAALRSKDAFTSRRIADASGELQGRGGSEERLESLMRPANGARRHPRFRPEGLLDALVAKSSRPQRSRPNAFDERSAEALREMLHRSAREFGYEETSLWTLAMAAEAAFERGLTERGGSPPESIRATLSPLLGVRWMRAERWITPPEPLYTRKKEGAMD